MTKAILAAALVLSLLVPVSVRIPTAAAPEEVKWEKLNIPAAGEAGRWALAPGSDIKHLTLAKDGTLYAYANPTGASSVLFKSTDAGASWAATGNVQGTITGIAAASDDAGIIYYATASSVHKSADGGKSFFPLPAAPGGAGTGNITITSLSVARLNGKSLVAIGTADNDNGQFGGIYTLDESKLVPGWEDTGLGNYDVAALAFAPYNGNRQLVAAVTDEVDTFVVNKVGSAGWNQHFVRATIAGRVAKSAAIAFPDGYNITSGGEMLFVGLDTGNNTGDVFRIKSQPAPENSAATDLNIGSADNLDNIDVTGLAVSGNNSAINLLAGAAGSAKIYISSDNGASWTRSRKEPTGQSKTYLLVPPEFTTSHIAYAATSGLDSAFSSTADGGKTWNQTGLIDTRISGNGIIDLAVSPNYDRDNTLFLLTHDSVSTKHSLWRSQSGGERWERVLAGTITNVDTLGQVKLSPNYGTGNLTVFITGTSNGNPVIWKSNDGGKTFSSRSTPPVFNPALDPWVVIGDNGIIFGTYNGTNGLVYDTDDGGFSYTSGTMVGNQPLKSVAISPNYERDGTILVGNSGGWVYYSSDNGSSFRQLPLDAASPPLTGTVNVAFDPNFAVNKIVYAASTIANAGVYRFVIGKSTRWERIDTTLPAGGTLGQLAVSAGGTLYAVNSQSVNATAGKGGIERSVNPNYAPGPSFETVTRGLDDGVTLSRLWLQGNQLWSIDTQNTALMTFFDSMAKPVSLATPTDNATGIGTGNVILKWGTLKGAAEYSWQLDYDTDFSTVPPNFEGTTQSSSARLPDLDTDTTYYWRVRATKPVQSPWSKEGSFTTGLGSAVIAPELYSPKAGAEGVSLKPLFQWSAIAGASGYEFMLSTNITFSNPIVIKTGANTLPATAWQIESELDYSTAYYWKVRASGTSSHSEWSAVSAFITQPPPPTSSQPVNDPLEAPPPQPPATQTQQPAMQPSPPITVNVPPAQSALPAWFPLIMGGVAASVIILAVAVLTLALKMRRF